MASVAGAAVACARFAVTAHKPAPTFCSLIGLEAAYCSARCRTSRSEGSMLRLNSAELEQADYWIQSRCRRLSKWRQWRPM